MNDFKMFFLLVFALLHITRIMCPTLQFRTLQRTYAAVVKPGSVLAANRKIFGVIQLYKSLID